MPEIICWQQRLCADPFKEFTDEQVLDVLEKVAVNSHLDGSPPPPAFFIFYDSLLWKTALRYDGHMSRYLSLMAWIQNEF